MGSAEHVSWFADIGLNDRPHVGGKGGSLGELQRAGIAVPPGFIIRTQAFETCIEVLQRELPLREDVESLDPDNLDAVAAFSQVTRARWEDVEFPPALLDELAGAYEKLGNASAIPAVAVRSSATTEDARDASFAGLQDTYLWVIGWTETLRAVRRCWASLYSTESICYRRRRGFREAGVAMAVVVQAMVDARTAGVMFTRSPTTGDRSVITVEAAWGLGSAVVAGEVTPDRWVMGKITGEISIREISDKAIQHIPMPGGGTSARPVEDALRRTACMSDGELQLLRSLARKVEGHYGCAQDVEWAVDRHTGSILLLQSRPETVWSAKESAPVARASDNPLMHVMSIFGGRR